MANSLLPTLHTAPHLHGNRHRHGAGVGSTVSVSAPNISAATIAVSALVATLSLNNTGGTVATTSTAWGDGTTNGSLTHTYASAGVYAVAVTATNAGGSSTASLNAVAGFAAGPIIRDAFNRGQMWADAARTMPATVGGIVRSFADSCVAGLYWNAASDSVAGILTSGGGDYWLAFTLSGSTGYSPSASIDIAGDSTICVRAAEITWGQRVVQSSTVNSIIALRRPQDCVYANADIHFATLVFDSASHTVTIAKSSGGAWALYLDGGGLSVTGTGNEFGSPTIGGVGVFAGESFDGKFFGLLAAKSNLTATGRQAAAEAYLSALG